MQLRRHEDILALQIGTGKPVAFHARNMEVAEISQDAFESLAPITLSEGRIVQSVASGEAIEQLKAWNAEIDETVVAQKSRFGIRSLTINVTQICNLHCTYCAAGGDGTYGDPVKKISVEKTLPQIKFFLEQIPAGEHFHVAFLGGEPLLYPDALKAIGDYTRDEAAKKGVTVSMKVTTNGTLVNEKVIATLESIRCYAAVSLDGPAEINDRQRVQKNGQGSFAAAAEGLRKLTEAASQGRIPGVTVHGVFNEKNLEVEKAWELFSSLAVDSMEFTYAVNAPDAEATRLYNEGLSRVAAKAFNKGGEAELLRIDNFRRIFEQLDEKRRLENHCGLGKSFAVVDSRNRIFNCPWTVGDKKNQIGEGTDLDYDVLERYQKSQIELNNCGTCWARFLCGGGCSFIHQSTTGDMKAKRVDFCERTRFLIGLALMYYHQSRAAGEYGV